MHLSFQLVVLGLGVQDLLLALHHFTSGVVDRTSERCIGAGRACREAPALCRLSRLRETLTGSNDQPLQERDDH